ncbi:hypothetical protein, partial [Alicyclobacillus sp.]|uniref:hypothetical protein n=1 Tax=Alicyclobacillus sp. TaxID=61169 RepID=UPI0025BE568E
MVLKRALVYVSSVSLAGAMPVMLPDSGDGGEVVATIQIPAQSPAAGRRTLRWLSGSLPSRLPTVHRTPAQFPDMVLDR